MNNLVFTYQHTCKKGAEAYILKKSAFKSKIKRKLNGKLYMPFLGEGFYYWEENIDAAHTWGNRQYNKNEYNIVEYKDCTIPQNEVLDFLNRRDLKYYKELISIYKSKRPKSNDWYIGHWIEFFKKIQKNEPDLFPFKYFRADENHPEVRSNNNTKDKTLLNYKGYYTFLDPLIIICSIEKNNLNCINKQVVF